jgi:nuclear pore complex protein Nup93
MRRRVRTLHPAPSSPRRKQRQRQARDKLQQQSNPPDLLCSQHRPTSPVMSLFGNLLPKNQAASGAPPAKNLFGTAAPASSAPSTNLFGNLGGSTTTAPSSGLFGNLGTASSAQSGASQTGTTDGVGVNFANASNAQQKPSGTTGMFQPSTAQNASQSTATNPLQQTAAGTQPSLFAGGAAPQQQQQAAAPLSQSGAPATKNAHFDHLLERGRKRNAGENGLSNFEELPSLQLGLGDIARKVRNLGAGGPSADQTQDRTA